jgi:hypothetical protein
VVNNEVVRWRELCRAASLEQDPQTLLELLRKINYALIEYRARTAEVGQSNDRVVTDLTWLKPWFG